VAPSFDLGTSVAAIHTGGVVLNLARRA